MQKQQVESNGPVQLSKFLGRDKDDGVRRSAVSGKKILLKLDKTKEDKEAESKRNELLKFLNASYDWLLKPKSWYKFPTCPSKCWSNVSSINVLIVELGSFCLYWWDRFGWIQPPVVVQYHASAFLLLPVWEVCENTIALSSHIWFYNTIQCDVKLLKCFGLSLVTFMGRNHRCFLRRTNLQTQLRLVSETMSRFLIYAYIWLVQIYPLFLPNVIRWLKLNLCC